MIGDPFLNYFALSGNDRNRDLPRHHAISDVRFGISIAKAAIPLPANSGRLGAVVEGPTWGRKRPSRRVPSVRFRPLAPMLPQPVVLPHRDSIHRCIY